MRSLEKHARWLWLAVAAIATNAAAVLAEAENRMPQVLPPLFYVGHGIVCDDTSGRIERGRNTVDGEVIMSTHQTNPIHIETSTVPAQVGVGMLVSFHVLDRTPAQTLEASVTHPPMSRNNTTRQTWPFDIEGGQTKGVGYRLEDDYELVPGPWTFQLRQADRVILEMTFDVVPSGAAPEIEDRCLPATRPTS